MTLCPSTSRSPRIAGVPNAALTSAHGGVNNRQWWWSRRPARPIIGGRVGPLLVEEEETMDEQKTDEQKTDEQKTGTETDEQKTGTAKVPETAEEARVLDDEELTRIVGGTDPIFWGTSEGPDWTSDG